MEVTIDATKEELDVPFPNFAERVTKALKAKYDEAKSMAADNKDGVVITVTITAREKE